MRQPALIGALFVVGVSAPAMATQLASDDLKTAVAGKTVTIDTPLGLPITVNYGANGLMTGTVGTALAVYLGADKDRGRWHVRNGKLCQKWFKWLSGEMTCLTLRQDGSKIYWRSDEGKSGTATIEAGPPTFAGVTASALGVPPPPARDADEAETPRADPARQEHTPAKAAAVPKPWPKAVAVRKGPARVEAHVGAEPRLLHAVAPATRPKYTLASLAPIPLPLAKRDRDIASTEVAPTADPFDGEPLGMRWAADLSVTATLETRWCHANVFAKEPSVPASAGRFAVPALVHVPNLLAVAKEQAYEGELPLHEASCLTADPGINVIAKLSRAASEER